MFSILFQKMVVENNIFIVPVIHEITTRNNAKFLKTKSLIQVDSVNICCDHSIELEDAEAQKRSLFQAICYEFFSDVFTPDIAFDCVAGICNMPAPANIVRMKDINADHLTCHRVFRHTGIALRFEKVIRLFFGKSLHLRTSISFFDHMIPDHSARFTIF